MTKTIVITGASDGIGAAAARRLHADGHRVAVVGRNPAKTQAVAREIGADHFLADFSRLDDVRRLAGELDAAYPRIDVLANNAGGIFGDRTRTGDGFETTFQVNHLGPFLLTRLLMPKLLAGKATVIQTSSVAARMSPRLELEDPGADLDALRAYGAAKLENQLFTTELQRRYGAQGLAAASFHPGSVATSFGSRTDSKLITFVATNPITRSLFLVTPEKGADQLIWLSQSRPGTDWEPGRYYEKRRATRRLNAQAGDAALARRLWERSEELLGMPAAAA